MSYYNLDKVVELVVGGSVINGPTPSSFHVYCFFSMDTGSLSLTLVVCLEH